MEDYIYTTEMSEGAKEKIGQKMFYCTRSGRIMDKEQLKSCYTGCKWACDRNDFSCYELWNLNGLHMMPMNDDPLVEVTFSEIPDDMKIKRTISPIEPEN